MGLLKAGIGAAGGVLADQWRDYFYCESLDADVLVAKGEKRTGGRSSNKKGTDNIISNGSIINVNDGQCMIIVESGKVVDICAEPGEFVYDTGTEPSIFYGDLGENIKKSFAQIGKRFTFGGEPGKDQRVYYFNTKEIIGNKYGTPSPVPFRVVDNNIGLDMDIAIRCHGEYSYKITNPMLFYTNVCGNVENIYLRETIDSQLKTELLTALQPAFAKISEMGIRYSALPAHTSEIGDALNEELSAKWRDLRGIEIVVFGVSSVKASEEDEQMIKEVQRNAAFRNPNMAAAHMVGAQAQAMQDAAKNEGGMGAMGGFFGMNMAQNAGGMNGANLFAMAQQQQQSQQAAQPQQAAPAGWNCECGQTGNTGKFCMNCGKPQPSADGWTCSCGTVNKGKFCQNCGSPKPAGAPLYKCDKCGWEPEDPAHPPKFCPECGDIFDDNDKK
ncbi:MAG: SPFH domain-containing protein [Clostridia bacterium]|nr:SPFH domain-containing protein [Clostridia bacterium]